eukprot:UN28453
MEKSCPPLIHMNLFFDVAWISNRLYSSVFYFPFSYTYESFGMTCTHVCLEALVF